MIHFQQSFWERLRRERAMKRSMTPLGCAGRWRAGCAALLVWVLFGLSSPASAQEAGVSRKLSLKEAVSLAMRNSRDLALARLQYGLVQREAGVDRSVFRPNFYTGSGAAYTSGFPLIQGGGAPTIFSLSYDQQIYNPPLRGEQRAAEQRAEEQRLKVDSTRDAIMIRAALDYLELAKVRHSLDLMRSERLSAGRILDATRERSAAGRELPIEVTRAELATARIEQRIAQMEDREDTLVNEMLDMMGLPQDLQIEVSPEDLPGGAVPETKDQVPQALESNIELKQAETERKARELKLRGERGGYWPTFGLMGQYNIMSNINNYSSYFSNFKRNNVIFGIEVKIPIFAARTGAAVAFAQANLRAAELSLEKKRSEVSLEVRQRTRRVRETDLAGEVARLELQLAQENLRIVQAQFDQGRTSLKDLEAAHLEENDRWLAFLDANFGRQQAQLELLQTTGQVSQVLQ